MPIIPPISSTLPIDPTATSTTSVATEVPPPSTSVVPPPSQTETAPSSASLTSTAVPTTTAAPPPPPPPTTFATSVHLTTSDNNVITITSVIEASPTNPLSSSSSTAAPRPFFQNKAAVAGVFSVAGLIGLALIFVLVTNAIRRRRAEQFDRDVAEAAAAAAASEPPVFDDEDDGYGNGGKYTRFSDNSHGTYGQPPMTHTGVNESYGMSEMMHPYDPFGSTAGAGAAGVGVGAPMQRARSRKEMRADITGVPPNMGGITPGFGEHGSPYPAFAGPSQQQVMYDSAAGGAGRYAGTGNATYDLMDAAGLGTIARGPSQRLPNNGYPDLSRSKSQGARSVGAEGAYGGNGGGGPLDHVQGESYAERYQPGYQHQPPPPVPATLPASGGGGTDDAYGGGYIGPSDSYPNQQPSHRPVSQEGSASEHSDGDGYGGNSYSVDNRASLKDEEDYELERGKRVLKVANE